MTNIKYPNTKEYSIKNEDPNTIQSKYTNTKVTKQKITPRTTWPSKKQDFTQIRRNIQAKTITRMVNNQNRQTQTLNKQQQQDLDNMAFKNRMGYRLFSEM